MKTNMVFSARNYNQEQTQSNKLHWTRRSLFKNDIVNITMNRVYSQ